MCALRGDVAAGLSISFSHVNPIFVSFLYASILLRHGLISAGLLHKLDYRGTWRCQFRSEHAHDQLSLAQVPEMCSYSESFVLGRQCEGTATANVTWITLQGGELLGHCELTNRYECV